ncbi:MAG: helix-turn-helix domain-containing protein [Stackebrandtia sp.]
MATIARSLRRERDRAGLSLSETAKRAGIAKSTLSQLESGTGNPSVETLWALSVTLDVPFSHLVDPPRPRINVIRAGTGPTVPSAQAEFLATLLSSCPPNARRDLFLITADPGGSRDSEPHMPGVTEHVVLCRGSARVGPIEAPVSLDPGDYISYPGDAPHTFEALSDNTFAVLLSEHI